MQGTDILLKTQISHLYFFYDAF